MHFAHGDTHRFVQSPSTKTKPEGGAARPGRRIVGHEHRRCGSTRLSRSQIPNLNFLGPTGRCQVNRGDRITGTHRPSALRPPRWLGPLVPVPSGQGLGSRASPQCPWAGPATSTRQGAGPGCWAAGCFPTAHLPSGRSRSPRSLFASCAGTCEPSDAPKTGGCSRAPAAARSAKTSTAGPGIRPSPQPSRARPDTWPPRRPYDLRHAALSLWLASGAPPAEVAARAGHSVRVLLTIYAHCIPGCDQIASQHIDRALHASTGPPLAHKTAPPGQIPSAMRPRHSWTGR